MQRAERLTPRLLGIQLLGPAARLVGEELRVRAEYFLGHGGTRNARLDHLARRDGATLDLLDEARRIQKCVGPAVSGSSAGAIQHCLSLVRQAGEHIHERGRCLRQDSKEAWCLRLACMVVRARRQTRAPPR